MGWTKTHYYQMCCSELYIRRCLPLSQQASIFSLKKSFTAGNMRHLILVAAILRLSITTDKDINGVEMKFGDIISFPPVCEGKLVYKHFAVYVGNTNIKGKQANQNIFHRLKNPSLKPTCVFDTLKINDEPEVNNYLDGFKDDKGKEYKKGTDEEMKARILQRYKKCKLYLLLHNNCEHLATYVRYGVKVSLQFNMTGEKFCIMPKAKKMVEYVRNTTSCPLSPNGYGD